MRHTPSVVAYRNEIAKSVYRFAPWRLGGDSEQTKSRSLERLFEFTLQ